MKLSNIFAGNTLRITQTPHGALQNYKSIDCVGGNNNLDIHAPADGRIEKVYGSGTQSGFFLTNKDWSIIFHHCRPFKTGVVKRGDHIGQSTWHHAHTAIKVNGIWDEIIPYMDRRITLSLGPGFSSQRYRYWSYYPDKQLPGYINLDDNNMKLLKLLKSQRPDVLKEYSPEKIDEWWATFGYKELIYKLEQLDRSDVIGSWAKNKIDIKDWYINYGSKEYENVWTHKPKKNTTKLKVDNAEMQKKNYQLKEELEKLKQEVSKQKKLADEAIKDEGIIQRRYDYLQKKHRESEIDNNRAIIENTELKEKLRKVSKRLQKSKRNLSTIFQDITSWIKRK